MKCATCGKDFKVTNPATRNIKYCSLACRKVRERAYAKANFGAEYQREALQRKREAEGKPLIPCMVCGKKFRQVGTHVIQRHNYETARQYREDFGFDVKKGQLPDDYREIKREHVFDNGTVNNLKKGKKYWFKPGDERAGDYKRSPETMHRLSQLGKLRKK